MQLDRAKTEPFRHLELLAKKVVEGFITGLHKSPFHGFSVEFAEHRLYNNGESTRHIDWKLFARSEKLFVKRYEEETNLRCQVVLDTSPSMLFPQGVAENKLQFSIYAAAALGELLRQQRDAVGLTVFGETVEQHLPPRGTPLHRQLVLNALQQLLDAPPHGKVTSAAAAINQVAGILHQRSLVVIFSDMFESRQDEEALFLSLQHLRHRKHEVVLFHVTDRATEMEFDFGNQPHVFVDLETGEEVRLNPTLYRDRYRASVSSFVDKLRLRCGQYGIDLVEADIRKGFHDVLYTYLLKRQRMV